MGRKLNLSHLSDGECRQILDVVQRDFRLRQREKERIGKLKKKVDEEEEKRSVLSRQHAFNQKHCMRCFSAFGLVFNKRGQCVVCHYFFCKDCRICVNSFMWICKGCILERQFQSQAFEWYYDKIKDRFRRYGSAKVVRSLYKRKSNECFESPSDQSNTDSGFEHQLSPKCRNNRCSIAQEDKSTNTGLKTSVCSASAAVQNKDFLESMRPDMENVSTQWPPASRRNSYRSESLSPDTETWQMSNISDQMEVLEQCLSSLEKTLVGDSESDEDDCKQNRGSLSPQDQVVEDVQKLEQKLQVHDHCLGMETEQTAAIAVRMITNTALKVLATTENVIETEHAQFASGDVKIQSAGKPAKESLSSDSVLDLIDLRETSVDSVQETNLLPITNVNEMANATQNMPNSSVEPLSADAGTAHVCNIQNDLAVKPSSVEENGNCFVNDQLIHVTSSHGTSTNSLSSSLKTGARRKDSVNGCRKKMKGTFEEQCDIEHIDEVADEIIHLEEKVYLSASHVFSLEDKLSKLENQVRGLDITASEELIGGLEDELALTLAQVAHSENQVCSAEDRIDQLKSRTGFVQGVSTLVYASEANFNSPVDQGHTDSRTQRHDSQFQNDLLINSTYVES